MAGDGQQRYVFSVIRERLRQRSGPVVNFALGDLGHDLPMAIAELIHQGSPLAMKRASAEEVAEFAETVVAFLDRQYRARLRPEQILPASGGRTAMTALVACVLRPGDGVLVTEPGYPAFARVARHQHARILSAALDPEREFLPALEGLSVEEAASIRLIGLNYPNNPTGAMLRQETVRVLTTRLGTEAILFNDATYGPLSYHRPPTSLLAQPTLGDGSRTAVELHSLSKLFALGPLAISFLAGSEPIIERIRDYSDFAWTPLSSFQLQVATHCLREAEYLERVRAALRQRLADLREILLDLGFEPYPAPAGIYQLVKMPRTVGGRSTNSAQEAADALLEQFGLAVVSWDVPPHGYLRFTALYRPEDLESLARLKGSLKLG